MPASIAYTTAPQSLATTDSPTFAGETITGAVTFSGGAAAAAVVARFGDTSTEGLEVKVIDEDVALTNDVATDLTENVPTGAVILSVQVNLTATVVGDGSGDDLLAKVGIGIAGNKVKYGVSADLIKNTKIDTMPDWAVLSGAEDIQLYGIKADGSTACTEKFVAASLVRVRIVYLALNSLDNAA